ncbi:hypothetical protein HKX48_008234 [Thoreauomyces humboldtii]|nr:hypothetical protein HKX48_008234 [Thoreauomyces humboldtii]
MSDGVPPVAPEGNTGSKAYPQATSTAVRSLSTPNPEVSKARAPSTSSETSARMPRSNIPIQGSAPRMKKKSRRGQKFRNTRDLSIKPVPPKPVVLPPAVSQVREPPPVLYDEEGNVIEMTVCGTRRLTAREIMIKRKFGTFAAEEPAKQKEREARAFMERETKRVRNLFNSAHVTGIIKVIDLEVPKDEGQEVTIIPAAVPISLVTIGHEPAAAAAAAEGPVTPEKTVITNQSHEPVDTIAIPSPMPTKTIAKPAKPGFSGAWASPHSVTFAPHRKHLTVAQSLALQLKLTRDNLLLAEASLQDSFSLNASLSDEISTLSRRNTALMTALRDAHTEQDAILAELERYRRSGMPRLPTADLAAGVERFTAAVAEAANAIETQGGDGH